MTAQFWKLYREERKKLAPPNVQLTPAQIVHAARTARKRLDDARPKGASAEPDA